MKIAIASGKGGTGKTTLAVNLALYASQEANVLLADLDVEEPNGIIFIQGTLINSSTMYRMVPLWQSDKCNFCGKCTSWCRFNSIVKLDQTILVLNNLCHSCYSCSEQCPAEALPMVRDAMGVLTEIKCGKLSFVESRLNIGIEMGAPLISQTLTYLNTHYGSSDIQFWDCPPGTSCSVIAATRDADFVILVTEPTPFGIYDLSLAVATMRHLKKDFAVVINRFGIGNDDVLTYCEQEKIPIWAKIPHKRELAELYSKGQTLYDKDEDVLNAMKQIVDQLKALNKQNPPSLEKKV